MEKNRNILTKALKNLPDYSPEDKVWNGISENLDKDDKAIKLNKLSSIEPPLSIWENIDKELTRREIQTTLKQYDPPASVWENIEQNLSTKNTNPGRSRIIRMVIWSSAVAALLLLGYFIITVNTSKNFDYSEEILEIQNVQEWNEEEQTIEEALNIICEEKPSTCSTPEFKILKEDLAFLDQSKEAILSQLSKYSANTDLKILLTEIELERTSLIKEMIAKTI